MKKIVLTVDYELFLGEKTGTVEGCMIDPTEKLASLLDKNDSKMTVFWDILHFYKLLEYENDHPELKQDRIAIELQIQNLAQKGHDVQLHIHPHWLDAKYLDGKWKFIYDHFRLHSLSKRKDPDDIRTILGCVTISKKLMENIVRKVDAEYNVYAFRAGGYQIEPFYEIRRAFSGNDIFVDSSVCPGIKNDGNIGSYDFTNFCNQKYYKFDLDLDRTNNDGKFIEVPISSVAVPLFRRIYYVLLRRLKYKHLESGRKGSGSGGTLNDSNNIITKIHSIIFKRKHQMLTTDSSFREKYNYLLSKVENHSTQILHPKLLNNHTIDLLNSQLATNKVKYISIKELLN